MQKNLRTVWEVGSTLVLVGAALVMFTHFLWIRLGPGPEEVIAEDWREWKESAVQIGTENATMVVAVFMDFSCPHCEDLVPVLNGLGDEFPDGVLLQFLHFPLVGPDRSTPGAILAECADRQGKFAEMYETLFFQRDSILFKAPEAFAEDAGLPDPRAFSNCAELPREEFPRISAGRELGERIGVTGTPSVWVNGELYHGRTLRDFRAMARKLGVR